MKSINLLMIGIVFIWFTSASAAIFWVSSAVKADFDPRMNLSQAIMSLSFEQDLIEALANIPGISKDISGDSPIIYHITQGDCYCEFLAKSHQSTMQKWSQKEGFINVNIDIKAHPQLAHFIPSTPALVAMSANESLIYLGPYSRGSGCFASSGEVDTLLKDWQKQTQTQAQTGFVQTVIDTDASGCYCTT